MIRSMFVILPFFILCTFVYPFNRDEKQEEAQKVLSEGSKILWESVKMVKYGISEREVDLIAYGTCFAALSVTGTLAAMEYTLTHSTATLPLVKYSLLYCASAVPIGYGVRRMYPKKSSAESAEKSPYDTMDNSKAN